MSRILLIDDDFNLLQMVKLMLERVGHTVEIAKDGEKGIVIAGQTQPDLAVIDVMMPGLSGYDVVRRLRLDPLTARIPIIILTARSQPMDKEMALEAGANAFLAKPVTAQELTERVDAVIKAGVNFRVHTGLLTEPVPAKAGIAPVSTQPAPPITQQAPASPSAEQGPRSAPPPPRSVRRPIGADSDIQRAPIGADHGDRMPIGAEHAEAVAPAPLNRLPVVSVISLRGGTGGTTIAINLALALAQGTRRVCLAELSTAGGHVPLYLHLKPPQNWGDLLIQGDQIEQGTVGQLLVQHPPSGVSILAAPARSIDSALSGTAAQAVLRELTAAFSPVVLDLRQLDGPAKAMLQASMSVVVVMTDDPPAIQSTTHLLAMLEELGVDIGRVRVVLNHIRPSFDVPAETIQKALRRPLSVEIPYEPAQVTAIRRGQPLVASKPDSTFARGIQQLARTIIT